MSHAIVLLVVGGVGFGLGRSLRYLWDRRKAKLRAALDKPKKPRRRG